MHVVLVRFVVKAGREDAFFDRVRGQAADSLRAEPDCLQFDVCRDDRDRRRLLLYEVYTDAAAFEAHLRTAHFLAFDREVREWVEQKDVERWTRAEAAMPTAGARGVS